jgi:hypothetical protein
MGRFRNDSPEEICEKSITYKNVSDYTCSRTKGHKGRCVFNGASAAEADGVYECCRNKRGGNHKDECYFDEGRFSGDPTAPPRAAPAFPVYRITYAPSDVTTSGSANTVTFSTEAAIAPSSQPRRTYRRAR